MPFRAALLFGQIAVVRQLILTYFRFQIVQSFLRFIQLAIDEIRGSLRLTFARLQDSLR